MKSTVNYVIAPDKEELVELWEKLKKEVTGGGGYINLVLKLEKLIKLFLTRDGVSILSLINQLLKALPIEKSK